MISHLEPTFTYGDYPAEPFSFDVAFDADTTEAEALALIQSAWAQAEAFTNRTYRPITAGKCIVKVASPMPFQWPRHPYPAGLSVEVLAGGNWVEHRETYIPVLGLVELEPFTVYRLTQQGSVEGNTPAPHVIEAVRNLATYQAIQGPVRREFKSQSTGDSGFSREALMGLMYGSGAGALLASEVRS